MRGTSFDVQTGRRGPQVAAGEPPFHERGGVRTSRLEYVRKPRVAGTTKFTLWKLWNPALEGLTSFGSLPLRAWTYIGSATASLAIFYAIYLALRTLLRGVEVPGYASIIIAVLFVGDRQLIGEYVGRIYMEAKR